MKGFKGLAVFIGAGAVLLSACATSAYRAYAVDMKEVEKELTTTGVEGWIHGSVETQGIYVFTYRTPGNFFDFVEMSLVSDNPDMMKQFATFDRHDKVRIKGSFIADNPSPQKHIMVGSIELLKKYRPALSGRSLSAPNEDSRRSASEKRAGTFLVHAVSGGGQVLVVEYKDVILPIFVKNGALAQVSLSRRSRPARLQDPELPGRTCSSEHRRDGAATGSGPRVHQSQKRPADHDGRRADSFSEKPGDHVQRFRR